MTRWTTGAKWEPVTQSPPALWSQADPNVGYPSVIINGVDLCDRIVGASWRTGRGSWLDSPEPGTASIELVDEYAVPIGTPAYIAAGPAGELWHGFVDTVSQTVAPDGITTRLGLVDGWSMLLSAEMRAPVALAAGSIVERLQRLASLAGVPPGPIRIAPSVGALPQLVAVPAFTGSLSAHVDAIEKASNAQVAIAADGSWRILPRDAYPEGSAPVPVELIGDSCPSQLEIAKTTADHVANAFTIAGVLTERPASIVKYGRRSYDVPAGYAVGGPPYAAGFFDAVAEPAPYAQADVPVASQLAAVVPVSPFDYVRTPDDVIYQVLGVAWQAAPDEWTASLDLDRTQTSIAAIPTPEPIPPKPPPTTATVTETFACNADAYVVRTGGGSNAGNGASADLLVGLLNDGQTARGLVKFSLGWNGKVRRVIGATLRLRIGETVCAGYGSSPATTVYRVLDPWSEGSYGTRCSFSTGNAVTYPGPSVTSTGKASRNYSPAEGALVQIVVTDIVAKWAAGSPNYGFMLRGYSESSTADRCVFWGRSATAAMRPTLIVEYEYEV